MRKKPSPNTVFTHFRASWFGLVHSPQFCFQRWINSASFMPLFHKHLSLGDML